MATRHLTAAAALGLILAVLAIDLAISPAPNPYRAPPPIALGSGQAAGGAHCTGLPAGR